MQDYMRYYLVIEGRPMEVDHSKLNGWPYITGDAPEDAPPDQLAVARALESGAATIAYAPSAAAAKRLADLADSGEIEAINVWCQACGRAHGALREPDQGTEV